MKLQSFLLLITAAVVASDTTMAQRREGPPRGRGGPVGPLEVHEAPKAAGIAWFGTWDRALAEAKRTGRPILFMSAAPQCQNVPGVW